MSVLREIRLLARFLRVGWRVCSGRWFVYRDEPTWFVEEMAAIEYDESASDAFKDAVDQAREELKMRQKAK